MAKREDVKEANWTAVIARALAYQCLLSDEIRERSLTEKAAFLSRLGLGRSDAALILDTSPESLRVLATRARKGKRGKRGPTEKN